MTTPTTWSAARQAVIDAVKAHASANYNAGGWDVIVECWEDSDIFNATKHCRTASGAIKEIAKTVSVYADRQADAINSSGEDVNDDFNAPWHPAHY